jgi:hypothetical protein
MHVHCLGRATLLASVIVVLSSTANALTLSGNYVWRLSKICQTQLGIEWDNTSHVTDVFSLTGPSQNGTELGIASVLDAKHLKVTGYSVVGPAVVTNPTTNTMHERTVSRSVKYMVTSNSLLLTDPVTLFTDEYRAVFSGVVNNVAQEVYFQRNTGPCAITGSLTKQR